MSSSRREANTHDATRAGRAARGEAGDASRAHPDVATGALMFFGPELIAKVRVARYSDEAHVLIHAAELIARARVKVRGDRKAC